MTAITTDTSLGDVVTANPAAARVLERHGLDYCCGGSRTLGDACESGGVEVDGLLGEIAALGSTPEPDWAKMGPAELVDHLEAVHHAYLHEELPLLDPLAAKVAEVHGERHPELAQVRDLYAELHADLAPHLRKEEQVLFPMIRELAAADDAPSFHCGSLANPISVMMTEHDRAGELLEQLREVSHDYELPADACASYTSLYQRLEALEADTHLHVHKENNILFPTVVEMERRFADA